jgi:phosphate-selective porin
MTTKLTYGGRDYAGIMNQITGFAPTLTNGDDYRIYDDGTYWCVELKTGSVLHTGVTYIYYNGDGTDARTVSETVLNQFSSVDLGAEDIVKPSGKIMTVIWEIIFS